MFRKHRIVIVLDARNVPSLIYIYIYKPNCTGHLRGKFGTNLEFLNSQAEFLEMSQTFNADIFKIFPSQLKHILELRVSLRFKERSIFGQADRSQPLPNKLTSINRWNSW